MFQDEVNVAQDLRDAKALISDMDNWTQGEYACDASGAPIEATSYLASCWCATGAIRKVTRSDFSAANILLRSVTKEYFPNCFTEEVNDGEEDWLAYFDGSDQVMTEEELYRIAHADVMFLFNKAIEEAESVGL